LYNCSALVIPLQKDIEIEIIENSKCEIEVFDYNKRIIDYNKELTLKAAKKILQLLGIKDDLRIIIKTNLPINTGLGSSAGFSIALISTLVKRYKINLSEDERFRTAMEAEKIFHCATLGIDIIATMLQKSLILSIERNNKLKIKQITKNLNLHFLLISAGKKPGTRTMVEKVKQFSIENKERFNQIIEDYKEIIKKAEEIILNDTSLNNQENKEKDFAELINKNHILLIELGISNANIEKVISLGKTNGVLASKITGAGNGGYVLALVQKDKIDKLKEIFAKKGYDVIECGM